MNNISIRTRMLLLTLIPLLIISLILGIYLADARIQDSETTLRERGDVLGRHLARESEFPLFSEDARQLATLAGVVAGEDDVYDVTILNASGATVAHAVGAEWSGDSAGKAPLEHLLLQFTAPVQRSGIVISDNVEQLQENPATFLENYSAIGQVELRLSRSGTLARQREIIRNIVLLTLGSSLLCAVLAFWMGKGIVRPIMRLSRAVDGIRKGRLDTRVDCLSGGELGALESGFNDMATAMESSQSLLREEVINATNKLSLLLESLPVAVFHAEASGDRRVIFMTQSVKTLTGFDAQEFVNDAGLWVDRMHPEDMGRFLSGLVSIENQGYHEFEYRWQVKDGAYHWFYCYIRTNEPSSTRLIGMLQDITEFKKLSQQLTNTITSLQEKNRELDQSRKEALDAGRNKAVFLANMSHEIRTPLSSIIGYASKIESLLNASADNEAVHECARIIGQASNQLKRMIDDILSFSKLESGTVHLEQVPFDLRADFEDVISMMSAETGNKKIELSMLIDSDVPTRLVGDPGRINQVIFNLLSNAIKFTEAGHVDVHVAVRDAAGERAIIEVSVSDTGIGMPPEVMNGIFAPFHQGDVSISRRYGGTGLGLSIVTRVVELWDGDLGVESEHGKGSRFHFTIDCLKQPSIRDITLDERMRGRKVLLYDDYQPAFRSVRNLLLGWSMNLYQARSRTQIKPMIEEAEATGDPYDVLVIGAGIMDGVSGAIGLNGLLDSIGEGCEIPLLLLLNRQDAGEAEKIIGSRAVIMEKPVRGGALYHNICKLLGMPTTYPGQPALNGPSAGLRYDGVRVLLAEDNEFNRALITAVLETRGLIVTQADNGLAALERAREQVYDLVIVDIHLPGMDGSEAARHIRSARPEYRSVPIIALTADIFFDTPENLACYGINACLLKPLDERRLWRLIGSLRSASTEPAGSSRSVLPPHSPRAVERSGQVAHSVTPKFRGMESALFASLEDMSERLMNALRTDAEEEVPAIIHELKGVVCYLGMYELSHAVLEAEKQVAVDARSESTALCLRSLKRQVAEFAAQYASRKLEADASH
ncbi:MAG: response regulator [Gammaproteobacteria bacterium]|nr:response regulator [Gammaproteobacteria bacterium]